jgi:hypothetical protein
MELDDSLGEREDTAEDSFEDSDGQSLSTTGLGNTGLGGSLTEAPAHDWDEMMDRYTVNGRLLVNCENVAATRPAGGSQVAAKLCSHSMDSEVGVDSSRCQDGQKRPASRARSKMDA